MPPVQAPGPFEAGTAVLRRGSSRAALAGAGDGEPRVPRRLFLPPAHGKPAEIPGASPVVVIAVEAVPVVHGDLDLRSSFGSLPRIHALGAALTWSDPYSPAGEPLRGALVDRYV